MLVVAAARLAGSVELRPLLARAQAYLDAQGGVRGLVRRYGRDKTFAAPILTNAALAGCVSWREVPALPFELACVPRRLWKLSGMPVVSYAVPALVAIGQARYVHRPPRNPLVRLVRRVAAGPSLKTITGMQPQSGGFLEATPLTSFVVMSLASAGQASHPVVGRGVQFLLDSVRGDGSWPIDTNLATWNTSLALGALAQVGGPSAPVACWEWLLRCQHRQLHPYTGAAPGGWAWTDLSGGVPDADDTSAALLALGQYEGATGTGSPLAEAVARGVDWLLELQNRDGGWPTFCRGWGRLPFDRSGSDLTAHALRALRAWQSPRALSPDGGRRAARIAQALGAGRDYLLRQQRSDGSWVPLWFGNQDADGEENPVYGTARVLAAWDELGELGSSAARGGCEFLLRCQRPDGSWGDPAGIGPSSVEETAVACEAVLRTGPAQAYQAAVNKGLTWLIEAVEEGRHREPAPIGFYFARLWYYEKLYPLTFAVAALGRAARTFLPASPAAMASQP
jgi:squalene-hopene/tetraprenyl-beta-curcumene cyclase